MSPAFRTGLRGRLALLLALAILPAVALTLYNGLRERRAAVATVTDETLRLARRTAARQAQLVEGARQLSVVLARASEVEGNDPAACARLLASFRPDLALYSNVIVASRDGEIFASAVPLKRPLNMADRSWFQSAVRFRRFTAGEYQVGRSSGKAMIPFAQPVVGPAGEVTRVVSVGLDLGWMARFAAEARVPPDYSLTAVDSKGTVLVRYPEKKEWVGKPLPDRALLEALAARPAGGAFQAEGDDGVRRVHAYVPLFDGGDSGRLFVVSEIPVKKAYARIDRILYGNLALLAIVALATLLIAMSGAELLVLRPIRMLVGAAERLSAGDLAARAGSRGGGELGRLADAFDGMAASLQNRMAERQQAIAEAVESERRWRALLDSIRLLVVELDRLGRVEYVNPYVLEVTGYDAREVIGTEWTRSLGDGQLLPEDAVPGGGGAPPTSTERREGPIRTRTGEERTISWFDTSLRGSDGRIVGTLRIGEDVTEQRRLQEHARQQDRLAAVGELAAGIAHDFNNIVLSMTGYAELVMLEPTLPDVAKQRLGVIVDQGFRAAQLIRQILDFSRRSVSEKQPLELGALLQEICRLLERTLPEQIRLTATVPEGEHWIEGDPTQLQQILVNLAVNARDAMPEGGELDLRLERRRIEGDASKPVPGMADGEWLVLTVADTGAGIAPAHVRRIFEPFFTTKAPGVGTGLGLAQVYGLVKQHGGFVSVQSQLGSGTIFTLCFPPLKTAFRGAAAPGARDESTGGTGELVLLAEDEPLVLHPLRTMLEKMGYQVLTARSGREALALYERHAGSIALVLTDWVMPDGDGAELTVGLRARGCKAKILAMSGYPLGDDAPFRQTDGFLQKPVKYAELRERVARLLASS